MNLIQCHQMFALREDGGHGLLHPECDKEAAPLLCTALVSLSGMLENSETNEHLDEAVAHALALLRMEVVDPHHFHREVELVQQQIADHAELVEMEMNRRAMSN